MTRIRRTVIMILAFGLTFSSTRAEPATAPATRPFRAMLKYKLSNGSEKWPAEARQRIVHAMDAAVALYNANGEFDKTVTANYSPGTPTADANYEGWINFGKSISKRVALHEIGHTLGIGTHKSWQRNLGGGRWLGPRGHALIRALDGPDAVLKGDRQHFWPYGLNFDNESSPVNDLRHVHLVAAMREDMGILVTPE